MAQALAQHAMGRLLADDTFFKDGDLACNMYRRLGVFDIDEEELCHKEVINLICEIPGCGSKLNSVMELELHYNSIHRYTCATCRKSFASAHLLDLHIEETHDSFFAVQAERKPMYQCLVETCPSKFTSSQERHCHCVDNHGYPSNFRWATPKISKPKNKKSQSHKHTKLPAGETASETAMEVDGNTEDSSATSGKMRRGFVFGRGSTKKSFSSRNTEWHRSKDKESSAAAAAAALDDPQLCVDLMATLPSEDMS